MGDMESRSACLTLPDPYSKRFKIAEGFVKPALHNPVARQTLSGPLTGDARPRFFESSMSFARGAGATVNH